MLAKHKKDCLSINGLQSVRLEKGTIEFKNYFKKISAFFKIYVNFESNLENVEIYEGSCTKNIRVTIRVVLLTKLFVFMIDLVNRLLFLEVKRLLMNLLKQFLKSTNTVKK